MSADQLLSLFIIFPAGALLIGFVFLYLFYKHRLWSALIAGVLWAAYAVYETLFYLRVLCSGECNIRIDLLLIYPLLLLFSLIALGVFGWRCWRSR